MKRFPLYRITIDINNEFKELFIQAVQGLAKRGRNQYEITTRRLEGGQIKIHVITFSAQAVLDIIFDKVYELANEELKRSILGGDIDFSKIKSLGGSKKTIRYWMIWTSTLSKYTQFEILVKNL